MIARSQTMHPALRQLIDNKLAHTRAQQWELPIAEVRQAFRALWTPATTGAPLAVDRIDEISIRSGDAAISRASIELTGHKTAYAVGSG